MLAIYIQRKMRSLRDKVRLICRPLNKMVECNDCGWLGSTEHLIHTYQPDGLDGVVPVDQCPHYKNEL